MPPIVPYPGRHEEMQRVGFDQYIVAALNAGDTFPDKSRIVIPAKAGIQKNFSVCAVAHWIPAFAGMTDYVQSYSSLLG